MVISSLGTCNHQLEFPSLDWTMTMIRVRVLTCRLEGLLGSYLFRRTPLRSQSQRQLIPCVRHICTATATTSRSRSQPNSLPNEASDAVVDKYLHQLRQGSRAALASAITLVETEHKLKKQLARKILTRILQEETDNCNRSKPSFRIGLSGPPGAGKSSFIEVFGKFLTANGHKVAVLAVDPSSATTGGSLLGDKTRMAELTRDPNAYIRPSPARGHLGGVTRSTNEAIVMCEYAGYDIILIETIGVGQSEYAVTNMVDIFVVLLPPGGGDELQGLKRGIIERADIILVTKADGDLLPAAQRTQYEYMAALKFVRPATPKWKTKVQPISSKTKDGIDKFWNLVSEYRKVTEENFHPKRSAQRSTWMWTHIREGLFHILLQDPQLRKTIDSLSEQVEKGQIAPGVASDEILSIVTSNLKSKEKTQS